MAAWEPSPAIPAGAKPKEWRRVIDAAAAESARLVEKAHKTGSLGVGDAARWRSLQASLQAVGGLSKAEASISATGIGPLLEYANTSLADMTASLPAHAKGAVDELQTFLKTQGFDVLGDKGALGAAAARTKVAMTSDWANLAKTTQQGIIDATLVAMAGGQNPRDAARKMRGMVTDVGGITYGRALTIARTEMADLYDSSRIAYMKSTGVVDGWWWRARDDACPICQIQHGRKFAPDQHPNRHHNCRCLMVPLVDDDTPLGDYLPGKMRPRESVLAKLPKGWDAPDDLRSLIGLRDNPGWRPSLALVKPGTTIPGSKIPLPTPGWKAPKGWPDPPTKMDTPGDIGSHIVDKDGILHVTIADMPSNGAKYRLTDTGLDMALDVPNGKWIPLDKQMLEGENTIGKWVYYRLTHGQAGDPIQDVIDKAPWQPPAGYPLPPTKPVPLGSGWKSADFETPDTYMIVNDGGDMTLRYRLADDGLEIRVTMTQYDSGWEKVGVDSLQGDSPANAALHAYHALTQKKGVALAAKKVDDAAAAGFWTPAEGMPLPDFDALPNVPTAVVKEKYADGVLLINNRQYRLTPDGHMEYAVTDKTGKQIGIWKPVTASQIELSPVPKYAYARLVDEVNTAGGMKVVQAAAKAADDIPPIPQGMFIDAGNISDETGTLYLETPAGDIVKYKLSTSGMVQAKYQGQDWFTFTDLDMASPEGVYVKARLEKWKKTVTPKPVKPAGYGDESYTASEGHLYVVTNNEPYTYRLTAAGEVEFHDPWDAPDTWGPLNSAWGPQEKAWIKQRLDDMHAQYGKPTNAPVAPIVPPTPPPPTKPVKVSKPKPTVEDPTGWVGKPAPVAPVAPVKPEPLGEKAFTTLVDEAKKRYAALGTGKTLEKSYNWSYFEKAMQGDTSAIDYLVQNKYLSSTDAARWKAAALKAVEPADPTAAVAWARAMDEYAVLKAQHLADTKVWREANGLPDWEWLGFDDVRRHTDSEGPAWADRTMPRLTHSTAGVREMHEYTGSSFRPWNDELRDAWSGRGELRTWKAKTLKVDKVMTPSPEDVILVRGTDAGEFRFPPTADEKVVDPVGWGFHRNAPPPPMESLVGTVQHQPGYWSTSAGETSGYAPHAPVQLKIRAPKGTPMAWARPVSSFHHEREMIVGRGQDFYVHAVYKRNGQWIVEVEVLPPGTDAASVVMSPPRPASVPFTR